MKWEQRVWVAMAISNRKLQISISLLKKEQDLTKLMCHTLYALSLEFLLSLDGLLMSEVIEPFGLCFMNGNLIYSNTLKNTIIPSNGGERMICLLLILGIRVSPQQNLWKVAIMVLTNILWRILSFILSWTNPTKEIILKQLTIKMFKKR